MSTRSFEQHRLRLAERQARSTIRCILLAIILALLSLSASAAPVKMSSSGICHCPGGDYYDRTSRFTPYASIDACLSEGGQNPERGQGRCLASEMRTASQPAQTVSRYDRDLFGAWIDEDEDCQNTRHELLADLTTGPLALTSDNCRVIRGRWNDPYTGRIFTVSRDLDIDHMVPLRFAWDHGANRWDRAERILFANDTANLFAVHAGTNRGKSAAPPWKWLPPNRAFQCEYTLRFTRIVRSYRLSLSAEEEYALARTRSAVCG